MSTPLRSHGLQQARIPCHSLSPRVCLQVNCVDDAIQPSHSLLVPFSWPQSFPGSRSLLMSQLFASGGQNTGASASTSVLPMNIEDWFLLGLIDFIFLLSKGFSKVFSSTQFKSINSLAISLLYGWTFISIQDYWKNHSFDCTDLHHQSDVSAS